MSVAVTVVKCGCVYVYVCNEYVWEDVHVCVVSMSVGMRREGRRGGGEREEKEEGKAK